MTRRKSKDAGASRVALGHSPLALAAAESPQTVLPFRNYGGGGSVPRVRAAAVAVSLPRSSSPRAVSGLAASIVDVYAGRQITVDPLAPRTYLPFLTTLAITHPAISQAIKLIRANSNRGHSVVFDAPDGAEALIEQAQARLDAFNRRVYPRGGVDGLINSWLTQLCITGALSAEDVVRPGRHVERIVSVPVYDVEFYVPADTDDGDWRPFQRTGTGLRRLNERTYAFSAWQTVDNNPYPIPPFIAAINAVLREEHIDDQLDAILKKVGWLGLLSFSVPLREEDKDMDGRDEDERFRDRQSYLTQLATNLGTNFREGLLLKDEGMTLDYEASPTASMAGASDILRYNEERLFSGIGLDPALFGRTWAKTETWLGMAKSILEDQSAAFQRLAATRLEMSLATDFALGGLHLRPWVQFTAIPTMRPQEEALAEDQRWKTALDKVINGVIDATTAAREIGYDEWHDVLRLPADSGFDVGNVWNRVRDMVREGAVSPEDGAALLGLDTWADPEKIQVAAPPMLGGGLGFRGKTQRVTFKLDRDAERYTFARPALSTVSDLTARRARMRSAVVSYLRGSVKQAKPRRVSHRTYATVPGGSVLRRMVDRFLGAYAGALAPILDELQFELLERLKTAATKAPTGTWRDGDEFGSWAVSQMQRDFGDIYREKGLGETVLSNVRATHEEMNAAWRREDRSAWAGGKIPQVDADDALRAADVSALAEADAYHVSIYLEGMSNAERETLQKMISEELEQAGGDINDPDVMDRFLNRMERGGGLMIRRRDHGREGGAASETDEEALARMGNRVRRIAETTVMRSRNVSQVRLMQEAGIDEFVVVQVGTPIAGEICTEMAGHVVAVSEANQALDDFLGSSPEQQEETLTEQRALAPDEIKALPGASLPPLHPNCRCYCEARL